MFHIFFNQHQFSSKRYVYNIISKLLSKRGYFRNSRKSILIVLFASLTVKFSIENCKSHLLGFLLLLFDECIELLQKGFAQNLLEVRSSKVLKDFGFQAGNTIKGLAQESEMVRVTDFEDESDDCIRSVVKKKKKKKCC